MEAEGERRKRREEEKDKRERRGGGRGKERGERGREKRGEGRGRSGVSFQATDFILSLNLLSEFFFFDRDEDQLKKPKFPPLESLIHLIHTYRLPTAPRPC